MFQPLQKVIFVAPKEYATTYKQYYPFKDGECLLYLGEIPNMPGHVAVVDWNGKVHWGYHMEDFRNPTEDEL